MKILLLAPTKFALDQAARLLRDEGLLIFQGHGVVEERSLYNNCDTAVLIFPEQGLVALGEFTHHTRRMIGAERQLILCVPQISPSDRVLLIEWGASEVITPRNWSPEAVAEGILAEAILAGGVQPSSYGPIVGATSAMRKLYRGIEIIAKLNEPVLILGESGTGKELVAKAIHDRSDRPGGFLTISLPMIPPELLGSELFGHERGAFTGADRQRKGLFAEVGNGTILLDEVGDLNLQAQATLLGVLEDRKFRPVGSNQWQEFNARLLLSTSSNLEGAVAAGRFRRDLYNRIIGLSLELPPLRERRADLPLLVHHFVTAFNREYQTQLKVPAGTLDRLFQYDWPGNVRQLRNAVWASALYADRASGLISASMLQESVRPRQLRTKKLPLSLNLAIDTVYTFLEEAGAVIRYRGERSLEVTSVPYSKLTSFVPLPVLLTSDSPIDEDVAELAQSVQSSSDDRKWRAGILFYRQQPDALALIRMADAQLRNRFITIPLPLAAAERALSAKTDCHSVLAEFAERYLPGANLFDDRNAISDTATFFGRTELLHRLEEDLLKYQGIGLFGLRKSGKTSVLLQLALILRQHPVVHLDLQWYGGKSRYGAELFNEILQRLSTLLEARDPELTLRFEPFARDAAATDVASGFAQRVSMLDEKLHESGYKPPIVCLLDEVERILPSPEDSREKVEEFNAFFGALRALCQQERRLSLLVTDVHPDCNRINQWTQTGVPTNPVFKFFKEVFLTPFTAEDTATMLISIGRLMGCKQVFDAETLAQIYQASGGHPFIARQLASLLSQKASLEEHQTISWAAAQRYLDKALTYSSTLKDYIGAGIWGDLEKRQFRSAMIVLEALSCREDADEWTSEAILRRQIGNQFTENQLLDALQWLEAVGLIEREEATDFDRYRIRLPLLSHWLRMNLSIEEVRQWQIA